MLCDSLAALKSKTVLLSRNPAAGHTGPAVAKLRYFEHRTGCDEGGGKNICRGVCSFVISLFVDAVEDDTLAESAALVGFLLSEFLDVVG